MYKIPKHGEKDKYNFSLFLVISVSLFLPPISLLIHFFLILFISVCLFSLSTPLHMHFPLAILFPLQFSFPSLSLFTPFSFYLLLLTLSHSLLTSPLFVSLSVSVSPLCITVFIIHSLFYLFSFPSVYSLLFFPV